MTTRYTRAACVAAAVGAVVAFGPAPAMAQDGKADVSVSIGGTTRVQKGDSIAVSTEGAISIAVNDSTATAHGDGSMAKAINDSTAVSSGRDSTAMAINDSSATARGRDSTAIAINDATAIDGGEMCGTHNGGEGGHDGGHDEGTLTP